MTHDLAEWKDEIAWMSLFRDRTHLVAFNGNDRILSAKLELKAEKITGTMIFARSVWTLEIDGKPILAFEARTYREADGICYLEWLR